MKTITKIKELSLYNFLFLCRQCMQFIKFIDVKPYQEFIVNIKVLDRSGAFPQFAIT